MLFDHLGTDHETLNILRRSSDCAPIVSSMAVIFVQSAVLVYTLDSPHKPNLLSLACPCGREVWLSPPLDFGEGIRFS